MLHKNEACCDRSTCAVKQAYSRILRTLDMTKNFPCYTKRVVWVGRYGNCVKVMALRMTEMGVSGEETVLQNKPGRRNDPECVACQPGIQMWPYPVRLDEFLCCVGSHCQERPQKGLAFPFTQGHSVLLNSVMNRHGYIYQDTTNTLSFHISII